MKDRILSVGIIAFIALLGLSSFEALAEDNSNAPKIRRPVGLWIFGGMDFGYVNVNTSEAGEEDKNGFQWGFTGLGSYYLSESRWVFDLGGGWFSSDIETTSPTSNITTVKTRAGFFTAAGRYILSRHWQIGPVVDVLFGTDTSFSNTVAGSDLSLLMGIQAVYEIPVADHTLLRIIPKFTTDLSIGERQTYIAAIGIQIGIPLTDQPVASYLDPMVFEIVTLDEESIHFETASSKLKPESAKFLRQFGAFLSENQDQYDKIRVEGHTDKRGEFNYNMKLSRDRALSVKNALIAGGAPANRLEHAGYGPTRPIAQGDTPEELFQNRRVELKFFGLTDPTPFNDRIQELKQQFGRR